MKNKELKYEKEVSFEERKQIVETYLMALHAMLYAYRLIKKNEKN